MVDKPKLSATLVARSTMPGQYFDTNRTGLYLLIHPNGSRQWKQYLTIGGKRRRLGLGAPPAVSLADARAKALENKAIASAGGDPLAIKKAAAAVIPSFEDLARRRHAELEPSYKNAKDWEQWLTLLERFAFGRLGAISIDAIKPLDIKAVLMPIWLDKPEASRKLRQRVGDVMRYAVALGLREDDPVAAIAAAMPKRNHQPRHYKSISYEDVGKAVQTVRDSGAYMVSKLAFEFLVLTAARSGEVRGATWQEIDKEQGLWIVPAERMKAGKPHRVPLSRQAQRILDEALTLKCNDLVFPSLFQNQMTDSTLSGLLRKLQIGAVPHGFRTTFRVWLQEQTNASDRLAELCLAHGDKNRVQAAYARSDMVEKRATLMQAWADYIENQGGENIVSIRAPRLD